MELNFFPNQNQKYLITNYIRNGGLKHYRKLSSIWSKRAVTDVVKSKYSSWAYYFIKFHFLGILFRNILWYWIAIVALYGLVWHCVALCRLVSPCVALCRLVSPRMDLLLFNAIVMCGLIRLNMALSNLVWSCMAWPCMAWPCMAFLRTLVLLSLVQITQPYMRLSQCMTMHWQQFLSCISFIGFCLAK